MTMRKALFCAVIAAVSLIALDAAATDYYEYVAASSCQGNSSSERNSVSYVDSHMKSTAGSEIGVSCPLPILGPGISYTLSDAKIYYDDLNATAGKYVRCWIVGTASDGTTSSSSELHSCYNHSYCSGSEGSGWGGGYGYLCWSNPLGSGFGYVGMSARCGIPQASGSNYSGIFSTYVHYYY
jgi:hypothetical protein